MDLFFLSFLSDTGPHLQGMFHLLVLWYVNYFRLSCIWSILSKFAVRFLFIMVILTLFQFYSNLLLVIHALEGKTVDLKILSVGEENDHQCPAFASFPKIAFIFFSPFYIRLPSPFFPFFFKCGAVSTVSKC